MPTPEAGSSAAAGASQVVTVAQLLDTARTHIQAGRRDAAQALYEQILAQRPDDAATLVAKAQLCESRLDFATAAACYERALRAQRSGSESPRFRLQLLAKVGDCYQRLKRPEPAIAAFMQVLTEAPDYQECYMPCALLMERSGRQQEARELVARGLRQLPDDSELHYLQGRLAESTDDTKQAYLRARVRGLPERSRHIILAEMAAFAARERRYDEAMSLNAEAQAHASKRARDQGETADRSLRIIDASGAALDAAQLADWSEEPHATGDFATPIFVVGFPRSGTTLLEQILGAHPNLQVTDESQVFISLVHGIPRLLGPEWSYPGRIAALGAEQLGKFRDSYHAALLNSVPGLVAGRRIVDKNPMTLNYLGAIRRFFPDAPVLVVLRDPRDVGISCFFQTFAPNPDTVNFFTLEDTARYYARCMDLYLKLRDTLGLRLREVRYEQLVADFAPQARSLIDFVGEPWTDEVSEFHRKSAGRFIHTPSYAAVRSPVSTAATGRWRHYEKHLAPVLPILQPYLDAFGYD